VFVRLNASTHRIVMIVAFPFNRLVELALRAKMREIVRDFVGPQLRRKFAAPFPVNETAWLQAKKARA
jgi:hypothetical protein